MRQQLMDMLAMDDEEIQLHMQHSGEAVFTYMLENVGTPDSELRDEIIYRLLVKLLSGNHVTTAQMKHATEELIGDRYLFVSIGERDTNSVFTRSFSALWLTGLLWVDKEQPYLEPELRDFAMERCANYLYKENDTRGFTENGWAHAIAHGADLYMMIASHPSVEKRLIPLILGSVSSCFYKGSVYKDDEDERLVAIISVLVAEGYPEDVLLEWVEQIFDRMDREVQLHGQSHSFLHARTNILQFMKTLYFALTKSQSAPKLRSGVSYFIQKWQRT